MRKSVQLNGIYTFLLRVMKLSPGAVWQYNYGVIAGTEAQKREDSLPTRVLEDRQKWL